MKTLKRSFLIAAAATLNSYCFGQWTELNSGTSNWLKDIHCPTKDTCYVVGNAGTVLLTTNGGQNWNLMNSGINTSQNYITITCVDKNTCLISNGEINGIYKTIDGGNSWQQKSIPGNPVKIFMVNDSIGYAGNVGGGSYFKTTDGGETWTWLDSFLTNGSMRGIYFINNNIGFMGSAIGDILKTTNGGTNWSYSFQTSAWMLDIFFPTDSIGFAVAENGKIFRTTDQGNSWVTLTSGTTNSLNSIYCINADTCYIVGSFGTVLKTTDMGDTWAYDTTSVPDNVLNTVFFPTPNVGYIVGDGPVILKKETGTGMQSFNNNPQLLIFPNPFSESAIINYTCNSCSETLTFELYDLLGRRHLSFALVPGFTVLKRQNLHAGIYVYKITNNKSLVTSGKLIIQ